MIDAKKKSVEKNSEKKYVADVDLGAEVVRPSHLPSEHRASDVSVATKSATSSVQCFSDQQKDQVQSQPQTQQWLLMEDAPHNMPGQQVLPQQQEDKRQKEGKELCHLAAPDFSLPPSVYPSALCSYLPPPQQELQLQEPQQIQQAPQTKLSKHPPQSEPFTLQETSGPCLDEDTVQPPTKRMVLMELFTKSGVAKVDAILEHVEEFLANPVSGKLLIFAHHKKVLDRLSVFLVGRGNDFIRIDGSTASKSRHERMVRFQTVPSCRVAVLAITAAGVILELV